MAFVLKGRAMRHAQVRTVTSREFVHNVSAAKRAASEGDTVIITDRSEPSLAPMPIAEYRRLTKTGKNLVELLRMPEADAFDIDFEPIRINAKDIQA
ncbi:type II toxin-antitoxin system prevent-host-death family antitoxin [Variovorax saccharolyticus]|uniref:type II toxin-antitoxin system prevent-host-death family antitoxin n=1 Tax=Variovorax saccharolyticus TaxID=3053516 RepID=UPI002578BAF6|nr:type II toxin-antitoxin system prevent-host-death family antitoxin [Variovorax sp. J31P216]MDM0029107.1 type II toxin-antitoxin system prevent-host-death family antitoxin [Variovorax sp. J31P216]